MGVRALQRVSTHGRRWLLFVPLIAAMAWALPAPVAAQTATPSPVVEIDQGRFILLGPPEYEADLQGFAVAHGAALDRAYTQLQTLYGISLTVPINVRVYADWPQFLNLNTNTAALIASPFHTHVGTREIALIGPMPSGLLSSPSGLNMAHHELSGLFLADLSGDTIPAGLALGINQYVVTPGAPARRVGLRPERATALARLD
jgi:hypothetical protein